MFFCHVFVISGWEVGWGGVGWGGDNSVMCVAVLHACLMSAAALWRRSGGVGVGRGGDNNVMFAAVLHACISRVPSCTRYMIFFSI